jgi:excinuclease ABC subunit A
MRAVTQADWIIDLGPGPGRWGRIVASGVPGVVAEAEGSLTARYLKAAL